MDCTKLDGCLKSRKDSNIVLIDKKGGDSKYTLINKRRRKIRIITVDGCVKIEGKKCDFAIVLDTELRLVELKGGDVTEGLKQLSETLKRISICFPEVKYSARLVTSRFDTYSSKLKQNGYYIHLMRQTGANLKIKNKVLIETYK
jgi:hypothetical protein